MSERKKFRIQRALGIELPGLGKPGARRKRNYLPGQHGRLHTRKITRFGAELHKKQKLLFHYELREKQLRRFVRKAKRVDSSNWIESLIGLLERGLDNIVFRLGFACSTAGVRQLVPHGAHSGKWPPPDDRLNGAPHRRTDPFERPGKAGDGDAKPARSSALKPTLVSIVR